MLSTNFLAEYEAQFEHLDKLFGELLEFQKTFEDEQFRIVALGLFNQGKSTLLNQLVNDYTNSTFKVSDMRETRDEQSFFYEKSIFVDTPGLNANKLDDEVALHAQQKAHLYLFVHKATTGELNAQEMAFLDQFANKQGLASFFDSTIFVISNIASCADEQHVTAVQSKIHEQLCSHFGSAYHYNIMAIDSLRYAKGHLEHSELFIRKSGLNELKDAIKKCKEQVLENLYLIKKEKILKKLSHLDELVNSFVQGLTQELSKQEHLFDELNDKFMSMYGKYQEQEEITNNADTLLEDIAFLMDMQENDYEDLELIGKQSHCFDIIDRIDNNELKLEMLRQSMIDEFNFDPSCDFDNPMIEALQEAIEEGNKLLGASSAISEQINTIIKGLD